MSRTSQTYCPADGRPLTVDVQEGPGWRLVSDLSRGTFAVLVGGPGWACELTMGEAAALTHGCATLIEQYRLLRDQLLEEEAITLEHEAPLVGAGGASGVLWMALEGKRRAWGLSFVLTPGPGQRAVEGSWPPGSAAAFGAALRSRTEIGP